MNIVALPAVTLLYAGIFGLMAIVLAFGAGRLRGTTGVSVGDGGDPELLVAIRRHGNFAEFVPLMVLLMALLEMNGIGAVTTHVFGIVLVLSRIAHAMGLKADNIQHPLRAVGAGGTALLTLVMSVWAIVLFV